MLEAVEAKSGMLRNDKTLVNSRGGREEREVSSADPLEKPPGSGCTHVAHTQTHMQKEHSQTQNKNTRDFCWVLKSISTRIYNSVVNFV